MIRSELEGDDPTRPTGLQLALASRLLAYISDGTSRKYCPQLWPAIHGRKYLLPHYRQTDYASQDKLSDDFEFSTLATAMGLLGFSDDVHHAMYSNFCGALWYDRPTLFLERELAEPLAESSLPEDMLVNDIEWKWPQFRLMLPKGFITIEREGAPRNLLFLDLVHLEAEGIGLPPKYALEAETLIQRVFHDMQLPRQPKRPSAAGLRVCMNEPYMALVGGLDWSEIGAEQGTSYASIVPWNNKSIGELIRDKGPGLNTPVKLDKADDVLLDRMQRLAFNVLLFLSQKPMYYKSEVVRPLRQEGKHIKPALHNAHFLGQEQFRKAAATAGKHYEPTGRQVKGHFVKGHWRRQAFGPKHGLRRWQWISIYRTWGPDDERMLEVR